MPRTSTPGSSAAVRAGQLVVLVAQNSPARFTDLWRASDLPKSTVNRILLELERAGAVARDPAGRYSLSPALGVVLRREGQEVPG